MFPTVCRGFEMSPRRISPTLLDLPDKHFFTIGEVSQITWVKPHVLRYWETQFKALRPARRESGQRKYTRRNIELIKEIKKLVLDEKYTISGAKKRLGEALKGRAPGGAPGEARSNGSSSEILKEIKREIDEITEELGDEPS